LIKVVRIVAGLDARIGGPPVSACNSAIAAARAGISTTVIYSAPDRGAPGIAEAEAALRAEGIEVLGFPTNRFFGFGARWGVSTALIKWLFAHAREFDVIHAHAAWVVGTLLALAARAFFGRKAVLTPHEALTRFDIEQTPRPATKRGKEILKPLIVRGFDLIVMSSALEARESVDAAQLPRCAILFHPVYDDRAAKAMPRAQPIGDEGLRLGFLGRFHPKKNLDFLIATLPRLPEFITLTVAGDGPPELTVAYRKLARDLFVQDRIRWLGFVSGAAREEFFRNIDLLCMPSEFECFGMAAAEALGRGIPVLVSPDTGIAEVVGPRRCGVVCAAEEGAMAREVDRLSRDREAMAALSRNAAQAAAELLSFSAHGKAMREAYEGLTARIL
jgi:glycosyltransferase involved in cell wall biosynthesis